MVSDSVTYILRSMGADGGVSGTENELYSSCRSVGWRGISHDDLSCGKAIKAEMGERLVAVCLSLESPFR